MVYLALSFVRGHRQFCLMPAYGDRDSAALPVALVALDLNAGPRPLLASTQHTVLYTMLSSNID